MSQPPVIVVPGITATTLEDFYPVEPETVWSAVLHKEFQRLALHPDDFRYEALEPARVRARNLYNIVYGDLVEALRHELSPVADRPTPVFGFGYDWRQDCSLSALQLGLFISEVLDRTRLIPHYRKDPPTQVDLVGHSMGGLIIAKYLRDRQDSSAGRSDIKVRRVVTIGTPFRGSIDAVMKLTIGMGNLTGPSPRDREREMGRTIPALYQLLPSYDGAVTVDASVPPGVGDIFKTSAWQPSVLATLGEFIRRSEMTADPAAVLQRLLDQAHTLIEAINGLNVAAVLGEGVVGWLPIVGLGEDTHLNVKLTVWNKDHQVWFDTSPPPASKRGRDGLLTDWTGDGTVPFLGACPDFLARDRLVGVTKDDLSFWEIRDRVLADVAGLHGFLPRVNHVQKLTVRFLREDFDDGYPYDAWMVPGVTAPPAWPNWLHAKKVKGRKTTTKGDFGSPNATLIEEQIRRTVRR